MRPQQCICVQLIDDHARAQQVADGAAILFGNADEPGYGRKNETKNFLNAPRKPVHVGLVVGPAHDSVQQRNQRQKRDEHDGDIEGELAAIDGAAGDGAKHVGVLVHFFFRYLHRTGGFGLFRLRHQHFGHQDSSRGGHDYGREQVLRVNPIKNVSGHDATGDVRHAGSHDGH